MLSPWLEVAASGSTYDPREPDYFSALMSEVKARGLDASFRHLGMIPIEHVYALLRTSLALINPSRCEGWSTTVEEAKSFGVPMILSDIDVHREQTRGAARYFAVDDARVLAEHLAALAAETAPAVVRELQPDLDDRVKAFVADFVHLTDDVMQRTRAR